MVTSGTDGARNAPEAGMPADKTAPSSNDDNRLVNMIRLVLIFTDAKVIACRQFDVMNQDRWVFIATMPPDNTN